MRFDIDRAKDGEQITTIYGDHVRIICFDYSDDAPIVAIITHKSKTGIKRIEQFDIQGRSLGWYGTEYLQMSQYGA